jgi:hypothetical protein
MDKGARSVMKYYGGKIEKAIAHLFPEIGVEKAKFSSTHLHSIMLFIHSLQGNKLTWQNVQTRRKLLEKIAQQLGIDPLVADNWYTIPTKDTLVKTLQVLFPYSFLFLFFCNTLVRPKDLRQ